MQDILINRSNKLDSKLYRGNYYDFKLYGGDTYEMSLSEIDDMSIADFSDFVMSDNGTIYSKTTWPEAINNEFLRIETKNGGWEEVYSGDTRFFMNQVYGKVKGLSYPIELVEEASKYLKFTGGFYQGFFKLEGFDYQVLPEKLDHTMTLHFDLRPRTDYTTENTVNDIHPDNKGIFFYMGAKSENKYWPYYASDDSEIKHEEYTEIESDNKFLLFNHTPTGCTTHNWVDGTVASFKVKKHSPSVNYFPIMNHTKTGYTIDNIDEYEEEVKKEYSVKDDVKNNAFALMVKEDGSIGYKYAVLDCEAEDHLSIVEEFSKPGLVKPDSWNSINVMFVVDRASERCDTRDKNMKIKIFVNGFLVFISKSLRALSFKALNDEYEKQKGIPYNMSLGGGTLGLLELDFPEIEGIENEVLALEENFCGSFIGDIKSFKIYDGWIPFSSITSFL